jgi:hypothetical protein
MIRALNRTEPSTPEKQPAMIPQSAEVIAPTPDISYYVSISDNAKRRAESLERENIDVSSSSAIADGSYGSLWRKPLDPILRVAQARTALSYGAAELHNNLTRCTVSSRHTYATAQSDGLMLKVDDFE